jgi:hypothetical protein
MKTCPYLVNTEIGTEYPVCVIPIPISVVVVFVVVGEVVGVVVVGVL